jgi:hypothetical protein
MRLQWRRWLQAFLSSLALGLGSPVSAEPILELILPAEAMRPDALALIPRAITRGPGIRILSDTEVSASGFPMRVSFQAHGGASIDAASLRLEYLKEPLIDLTARVVPGLRNAELDLPSVSVPRGVHPLRLSIRDSEGRATSVVFNLLAH